MTTSSRCPDCGAAHVNSVTCQDDFYQMLYWEAEEPARGEVHHLTVLCYHLQHPGLYSPAGLQHALGLLDDFIVRGKSPTEVRQINRDKVASDQRTWKITARPDAHGAYDCLIAWTLTAADVIAGGAAAYCDTVWLWARSVYAAVNSP